MTTIDQGLYAGTRTTGGAPLPNDAPKSAFSTIAIDAREAIARLNVAERTFGSRASLAPLRWTLIIAFLWFGGMKFTAYEAEGIAPFIANSPFMSWLHALFGVQGASYVIGALELSTAAALIVGAFNGFFSALGAAMSSVTYVITLTFLLTTPGVAEPTAGGFPAISAFPGQFLLKDIVLLAASLSLLSASISGSNGSHRSQATSDTFVQ
ncbi:YkgB family protein [Bradyrhizobium sp. TZ2]